MRFGSVCSGIEAASMAWSVLGWEAAFFSEIEAFPSAVLAHHYPTVPNRGDMTRFQEWPDEPIDLLVGGTPCQSFSVAGLRAGLADPRGNLMLTYLAIVAKRRPKWVVWENVPGVLSSNSGRDFGTLLRGLGELGYGFAYRVLDAQYCRASGFPNAVPQRRRRVFVVGHSGDWRRAAAVLFDAASLRGDSAPSRQAGQGFAADVVPSLTASGRGVERAGETRGQDPVAVVTSTEVSRTLMARHTRHDPELESYAIAFGWQNSASQGDSASSEITPTLDKSKTPAVAFNITPSNSNKDFNARRASYAQALTAQGGTPSARGGDVVQSGLAVRRLTPRECERLQGFPDDYTAVPYRNKPAADGPRYKALGNSMAVNVMRAIGSRIQLIEASP